MIYGERNFEHLLNQISRHDKPFWGSYLKTRKYYSIHFFLAARRMKLKILLFLVFCAGSCYSQEAEEGQRASRRQGRVLFATTTTSTTTMSTYGNTGLWLVNTGHVTWKLTSDWSAALCWKASVVAQTGVYGCKKKRSLPVSYILDSIPSSDADTEQLAPTKSLSEEDFSIDEVRNWIYKICLSVHLKVKQTFILQFFLQNIQEEEIEGSRGPNDVREAKFLYYWATFTETVTSFTTTSSWR